MYKWARINDFKNLRCICSKLQLLIPLDTDLKLLLYSPLKDPGLKSASLESPKAWDGVCLEFKIQCLHLLANVIGVTMTMVSQ